jgi:hypothetical protein
MTAFSGLTLRRLRDAAARFDEAGHAEAAALLKALADRPLPTGALLVEYHVLLLFMCAHPADARMLARVEAQLRRIARFVRGMPAARRERLVNEGLPFGDTLTRFSHDHVRQLLARPQLRVQLDPRGSKHSVPSAGLTLNEVLALTLPAAERAHTAKGLDDDELLGTLGVRRADRLRFLVDQLAAFDRQPLAKDHFFDALDLFVRVSPRDARFSKAGNRLPMPELFFQRERLKRFDTLALMNRPLPKVRALHAAGPNSYEGLVHVVRDTLTLTARETDPGTYLDARTLRCFDLERGLSVVLYGMTADRQLPYESYVGFMLFKNGFGAAYGGSWVFGPRADFGMNIFEPYRGGESGFMMCQVLRVYRQVFGVRRFEVDAHQFGLDNPDGIASGAFWFYHRHGFRPVDAAVARLAEREHRRLAARPGARSSEKTLIAFTASNVALAFGGGPDGMPLAALTDRITALVAKRYRGSRAAALSDCEARFVERVGPVRARTADERRVLGEVALWAAALELDDGARLAALKRMVAAKPRDLYGYQKRLLAALQ